MKTKITEKDKHIVFWMDNVNLCVTAVCSTKKKAKEVATYANNAQGFHNQVEKFDSFIEFLKSIRRCRDENWIDFSPSAKEVRSAKIDYLFNLIHDDNIDDIDYENNVISIGIIPKIKYKA